MANGAVVFRGTKAGLKVILGTISEFSEILSELGKKISENKAFFENARIDMVFSGRNLSLLETEKISDLLSSLINVGDIVFEDEIPSSNVKDVKFSGIDEGMTKFFKGTLRSGQKINYNGNVVVIGDVNPGAEIIAGGNIVVMGMLRGLAHAGATGNDRATVAALVLQPMQLRISSVYASPPDDDETPAYPEIASLKDNNLVIEAYLPTRAK